MSKRIFITGINGQDGSYLAEYMLELGHEVHGLIRRNSVEANQSKRLVHLGGKLHLYYGNMLDAYSLEKALEEAQPDYVFHLAAQSQVRVSFDIPEYTIDVNGTGTLRLLNACRRICPKAHIYNASSSEIFGASVDADGFQRETTTISPISPYGVGKVMAHNLIMHYRRAYGMYTANGILFNHESPRRSVDFVTRKIIKGVVAIHRGQQDKLELGNLDSFRDWGHSKDYVRAMWLIVNHVKPMEFVIASGKAYSVRELCKFVFAHFKLNYEDYVVQNPQFMRPEEVPYLKGDATKARTILGWEPTYTFESLLEEMIEARMKEND